MELIDAKKPSDASTTNEVGKTTVYQPTPKMVEITAVKAENLRTDLTKQFES